MKKRIKGNYRIRIFYAYGIKHAELEKRIFLFYWRMVQSIYVANEYDALQVLWWMEKYGIPNSHVNDKTRAYEPTPLLREIAPDKCNA